MRVNEAAAAAKPLDVVFDGGAVLHITYRPADYTPNEAAELTEDAVKKDPRRMSGMAVRMVESWDLTDNDDNPIPITADAISANVHLTILAKVMTAIQKDQMPGEAPATSPAG